MQSNLAQDVRAKSYSTSTQEQTPTSVLQVRISPREERHAACTMQDADARLPGVLLHAANHHGAPPLGRAGPGRLPAGLRTTRC